MKKTVIAVLAAFLLMTGCATKRPEMVTVPNVVGLDESAALDALMNSHLLINWEPEEVGRSLVDVIEWVAVGQTQAAGSEVDKSSKVTVQFERIKPEPATEPEPTAGPIPEETDEEPPAPRGLLAEVETAFTASYGSGDDALYPVILSFSGIDAPRITVAVDMYPKSENEPEALGVCRAVLSIRDQITEPFRGVYVTAGEGGPFLAECDNPDY